MTPEEIEGRVDRANEAISMLQSKRLLGCSMDNIYSTWEAIIRDIEPIRPYVKALHYSGKRTPFAVDMMPGEIVNLRYFYIDIKLAPTRRRRGA